MFNRKYKKLREIMEKDMEKYYRWYSDEYQFGNDEKANKWFSKYFALTSVLKQFDES